MNKPISRRELLRMAAFAAGGIGFLGLHRTITLKPIDEPDTPSTVYLPIVTRTKPTATPGVGPKVVHVHSAGATSWTGQPDYWNHVNQTTVNDMVDEGMKVMTGKTNVADAWRTILPNYHPGQGIAIKVNFNNSGCSGSTLIDGVIHPVNAVVRGLKEMGVAESDVWVYDAIRGLPGDFVNGCLYPGVRFFDDSCHEPAGFSSNDPNAFVAFHPPAGIPMPPAERVSDVIINATYLINMPIMKLHSWGTTGPSLGFKNHWGTIDNPSGVHDYILLGGQYRRPDYNALVDVYNNPHIRGKTVLTVGDGLFGSNKGYNQPPFMWKTFGNRPPNSLFLATDPVAIDCVMCDFVDAECTLDSSSYSYLQIAHQAGMGLYEHGDPWGSGYQQIKYTRLER